MTVVQTTLVFVGIPLAVLLVVAVLVLAPSAVRGQSRYRPGRSWDHEPAWWLPETSTSTVPAIAAEHDSQRRAIAAAAAEEADRQGASRAEARAAGERAAAERETAAVGGASGEW